MKKSGKRRWQLWAGVGISIGALVLALHGVEFGRLAGELAAAEYVYLIPAAAGITIYLFARAVRWRLLLGPQVSLARCFWITNIGYMVSNVLPFRLGDPARAVVVGLDESTSTAAALSTVVVERVLDMLMVIAILAAVAPFVTGASSALSAGIVAGGAALTAIAVLILLAFRPDWGRRAVRWGLARIPRIDADRWANALDGLFEGLEPLRSGRRGLAALGWSVLIWVCVVGYYWAFLRAFVGRPPALAAPFLVCVLGLGMAVPSSPGAFGVFHAVARYALTIPFDIPQDQAVAVAFVAHTFQYILMIVLGLIGLAREGLSLVWIRSRAVQVESAQ